MSKPYDLTKKSDMRRFEKDLKESMLDAAKKAVEDGMLFEIPCPHCGETISAPAGPSVCPLCHEKIELTLQV